MITLHITYEDWKKLKVILEDCEPVKYYSAMAHSMLQQGYNQIRKNDQERLHPVVDP